MGYKDAVLASRPAQYFTLDSTDGNLDLSGFGNDIASAPTNFSSPIVPGYDSSSIDDYIPNAVKIFSSSRPNKEFTIEFWTNPGMKTGTPKYVTAIDGSSMVRWRNHQFEFYVTGTTSASCYFNPDLADKNYHVVATFVKNSIVLIVNNEVGYPVALGDNFVFSSAAASLISVGSPFMSHLAIYDRALTLSEVAAHYEAGTKNWDHRSVCTSDGGDFFGMSAENVTMAYDHRIDSSGWAAGKFLNMGLDRDGYLALPEQNDILAYNDGVLYDPSFSTGMLLGTTKYAIKDDLTAAISTTFGAIAVTLTSASAPGTKKVLLTINNKSRNKYWSWYLDSSNIPHLEVVEQFGDGTTNTVTYNYSTAVSNGALYYVFIIQNGSVKIHTGGTSTVTNQVSGSDWVQAEVSIDGSCELIIGADGNYVGPSIDEVTNLYFWKYLPASFTTDYNVFSTYNHTAFEVPVAFYDFDFWQTAYMEGYWQSRFSMPYNGAYAGHSMTWGHAEDGTYIGVAVSYNGGSYTTSSKNGAPIPNFPVSGTLGGAQVNGPFDVSVWMKGYAGNGAPRCHYLDFKVYADANFKSEGTDLTFTPQTFGTIFNPVYRDASYGTMMPNAYFYAADRLEFPSQTHNTIEFVMLAGTTNGQVLCARENSGGTERNVAISGSTITWTGFDTVYLNGASVSSGATITPGKLAHIICVYSAGITSKINFGAHYDGTLNPLGSGLMSVAVYDRVLTAAEISEHYHAAHGIISGVLDGTLDNITLTETTEAAIYSYAWQMTGAPK